jgi:hypothetical protein
MTTLYSSSDTRGASSPLRLFLWLYMIFTLWEGTGQVDRTAQGQAQASTTCCRTAGAPLGWPYSRLGEGLERVLVQVGHSDARGQLQGRPQIEVSQGAAWSSGSASKDARTSA